MHFQDTLCETYGFSLKYFANIENKIFLQIHFLVIWCWEKGRQAAAALNSTAPLGQARVQVNKPSRIYLLMSAAVHKNCHG